MKLEKLHLDKKNNKLILRIKDSNEEMVNTLRRVILEEVPTLAIEEVELFNNSSVLYDEMIALRMGLIPIKTDLEGYNFRDKCTCEGAGCAKCQVKISLKSGKKGYVTASEAKSSDSKCTFVYDMPIVKTLAGQKLEVEATAILGRGKVHAKWCPGHVFFRREVKVEIDDKKIKDAKKIAGLLPEVFELKGNKLTVNEESLCLNNNYDAAKFDGITIKETDNFIFTLESWGQLSTKKILETAAEIMAEKAEDFIGQLEE